MGEGQREDRWGEALWLLRFSGTVKQEVERGGRNLRGKIPESWRLIVKCLEIPQEVRQEEEERRRLRWSHTILPGRSCLPRGPSG